MEKSEFKIGQPLRPVRGMIREDDMAQLKENWRRQQPVQGTSREIDHQPVVRLYVPFTTCVWMLTELDEDGIAFALADLGMGFPELGSVWLKELEELRVGPLRVLQDVGFRADKTISQYASLSREAGQIVC